MFDYRYVIELNNSSTKHLFGEDYFGDKSVFWNAHQSTLNALYESVILSGFPIQATDLTMGEVTSIGKFSQFIDWLQLNHPFNSKDKDLRTDQLFTEILSYAKQENCLEFEFVMEMYGVMWYPTFIQLNDVIQTFSFNDISEIDLDKMVKCGYIERIKEYAGEELGDDLSKSRYRILNQKTL